MAGIEPSKTRQIYLVLRDRIAGGRLDGEGVLPAEQALAAEYGVSRVTVRRALAELEQEGLISRRRGAGTFVLGAGAKPIVADFSDVLVNLVAMGRETAVRLLAFDYREPPAEIARALNLAGGEKAQFSVRVRLIDGKPFSHLVTHVPERIGVTYSEADLAARPLLSLLERSGVQIERATQQVTAMLASPEVAAALEVEVGSALLGTTRTVFAADGSGVEHLSALYRPDRYALQMEMVRTEAAGERRWATVLAPRKRRDQQEEGVMTSAGRPQPDGETA
jgi:GntR family transcriptional regulator